MAERSPLQAIETPRSNFKEIKARFSLDGRSAVPKSPEEFESTRRNSQLHSPVAERGTSTANKSGSFGGGSFSEENARRLRFGNESDRAARKQARQLNSNFSRSSGELFKCEEGVLLNKENRRVEFEGLNDSRSINSSGSFSKKGAGKQRSEPLGNVLINSDGMDHKGAIATHKSSIDSTKLHVEETKQTQQLLAASMSKGQLSRVSESSQYQKPWKYWARRIFTAILVIYLANRTRLLLFASRSRHIKLSK